MSQKDVLQSTSMEKSVVHSAAMSPIQRKSHRILYMDGLRGVASLAVFLWHSFLAFFPGAISPELPMHAPLLEVGLYRSPFAILFAGDFAVYVFFVLSGFVVSAKFLEKPDTDRLQKAFLRRYLRLMPPAFVTVIAAYILLVSGLIYSHQVGQKIGSEWLLLNWRDVDGRLLNALWTGLFGVWFAPIAPGAHFNSNLGTLFIEMNGSFLMYLFILFCTKMGCSTQTRYWLHVVVFVVCCLVFPKDPHWSVFFVGMAIADLYIHSPAIFKKLAPMRFAFLGIGVYFGSTNIGGLIGGTLYRPVEVAFRHFGLHPLTFPWAIGAPLLLLGIMLSPAARRLFERPFCLRLGEYSFALFVMHTVFIGSVTCMLFEAFSAISWFGYNGAVAAAFLTSLPLLFFVIHGVKLVDDWAVRISRSI